MLKAYKHGHTFNLIFPLAKTNLDHLLRDPDLDCIESVQGPVESRSYWMQLLGIAKALGKIGGPRGNDSIFGSDMPEQYRGVHFDLKPANILIDDNNNWVISDFGQSSFRPTGDSTSRVVNQGGTDAYAPPEIDNLDAEFSRRYDVWSLGCITLEVTAFTILGYAGLNGCTEWPGLDAVRTTQAARTRRTDSRFFCQDLYHGQYTVKGEVINFMEFLKKADSVREQQKSRVFIERILDLTMKMLEPMAEDRIEIGEVIRLLESIIEELNDDKQPVEMVAVHGERSIGEPEIGCIRFDAPNSV
jgi:serine/threonine protein kinase